MFQLPRALSCCESGFCAALICFCAAEDALNIPPPGRCCALTGRAGGFKMLWFCSLLSQEDLMELVLRALGQHDPVASQPLLLPRSKTGRKVVPCQRLGRQVAFCWGRTSSSSSPVPPCHDYQCCVFSFLPFSFPLSFWIRLTPRPSVFSLQRADWVCSCFMTTRTFSSSSKSSEILI